MCSNPGSQIPNPRHVRRSASRFDGLRATRRKSARFGRKLFLRTASWRQRAWCSAQGRSLKAPLNIGIDGAIESTMTAGVHGRYLVRPAHSASVIVGFHGYGESAETQFDRLTAIRGSERWSIISIQALHPFYVRRTDAVGASWMTRQNRELAIADNITYVSKVLEHVLSDSEPVKVMVFAGFSQGVAMAYRAATSNQVPRRHVVAVGGDIPGELTPAVLMNLSSVLAYRGRDDAQYTAEAFKLDVDRLRHAGTAVRVQSGPGGHDWSPDVIEQVTVYLEHCFSA